MEIYGTEKIRIGDKHPGSATLIIYVPMLQIYILIRIHAFL
jgi:hypothetical protein